MLVKLKTDAGFTLIELAMVLFIVGLLLGGLLVPLSTKLEQERRNDTSETMGEIKETLLGYAVINGRLPCPDCPDGNVGSCSAVAAANRNDGIEDLTGSSPNQTCQTDIGNLPWVDLQVPEYDAWSRHFTYRVTADFSRESNPDTSITCPSGSTETRTAGVSFFMCSPGDNMIYADYSQTELVAQNVPAVVVSHGADAYEPVQTDQEVENYGRSPENPDTGATILDSYNPGDYTESVFVNSDYYRDNTLDPPTQYDDLLMWIAPGLLMNRMIKAGRLP